MGSLSEPKDRSTWLERYAIVSHKTGRVRPSSFFIFFSPFRNVPFLSLFPHATGHTPRSRCPCGSRSSRLVPIALTLQRDADMTGLDVLTPITALYPCALAQVVAEGDSELVSIADPWLPFCFCVCLFVSVSRHSYFLGIRLGRQRLNSRYICCH